MDWEVKAFDAIYRNLDLRETPSYYESNLNVDIFGVIPTITFKNKAAGVEKTISFFYAEANPNSDVGRK